MTEYSLSIASTEDEQLQPFREMADIIAAGQTARVTVTTSKGNGKWGMARLWRQWMSQTAEFMAANGATMPLMISATGENYGKRPFNADDAHELFTSQWLGIDDEGRRLSWAKKPGPGVADKGQRWLAMFKHEQWCIEKGINLHQPRNSEYRDLKDQQNA